MAGRCVAYGGPWEWVARVRERTSDFVTWPDATPDALTMLGQHPPPRYVFFVHWSYMVPSSVTRLLECVNFHCTDLPYGRGGHPIENLLLTGHEETVITAHRMTAELDAGPVYGKRGPVSLHGSKEQILARFVQPVVELMEWIVRTEPQPVEQAGEPVKFKRLSSAEYAAFWAGREQR